jgi:O-antigen/teichoic acid export membrane protein
VIVQRLIHFKLSFDVHFWKHILSKSWPLAFSVVLNLIYFKADALILSVFKPADDVGLYGLSYKFLDVLLAFPAMFAGLIMPFLARFAFSDWPAYRQYMQKSLDAILLAIVPMVVAVLFFARPIINLVGGEIYPEADSVLQILIFATAIIYVGSLMGYNVVALESQKKMVWGYLTGTIVGLALYFALIPSFSYYGAAIATVAVEFVVASFAYVLTSRLSGYFPNFFILGKAIIAAVPMVALFYYLRLPWVVGALIGLAVYTAMLYALKAIPKEFIQAILKKAPAPGSDIISS